MKKIYLLFALFLLSVSSCGARQKEEAPAEESRPVSDILRLGAERMEAYLPLLEGKRVALFSNHTGILPDGRHTLDALLDSGVDVRLIFSPEHGFRGTADAGEHVSGGTDPATGIKIASLYDGSGKRQPSASTMDEFDVLLVDIQDVGLRYYTYYCTMLDLIKACTRPGQIKDVVILDRPNPNGMTVDGPVLDMKYASGVGRLPIPTVHGMTLAELALMAAGEGWLELPEGLTPRLHPIACEGYTHASRYELPVAPSPNLRTMRAIYLYPSTCYFEGTPVSLGRGTDSPFEIYGHPDIPIDSLHPLSFTPQSMPGAKNPPLLGRECHGRSLRDIPLEEAIAQGVNLEYVIDAYRSLRNSPDGKKFFTRFFDLLMGDGEIRGMIEQGMSAEEIKATWQAPLDSFRIKRRPYLLYPDNQPEQ